MLRGRKSLILLGFLLVCTFILSFVLEKVYNQIVIHTPLIHPTNNTYIDLFVIDFDKNDKAIRKRVDNPYKDSKPDFTFYIKALLYYCK
jgi:hypothetical protein